MSTETAPPSETAGSAGRGLLLLYAATLFLSALLVFAIQPLFARMALPLLGGSSGVWNTAMVFFQAMLLAGYVYAHLTTRWLSLRNQTLLHLGVLALAFISLPVGLAQGWTPPTETLPVPWLIGLFTVSAGLPFFAVAANAPLLQKWFSHSGHRAAADPYFLYGASNLGSMLALISYPLAVEPLLRLDQQSWTWTGGYGVLVVLIGVCGAALWKAGPSTSAPIRDAAPAAALPWPRKLRWAALAFVPSSLLLGVTTRMTTDVAAVPLLWVGPLALYLLTFALVFARRPLIPHRWMVRLMPFFLVPLAVVYWWGVKFWPPYIALNLIVFFLCAMVCHGELAADRPHTRDLTAFYLWLSLGGVLGGVFNALIAPVVFDAVYEYPIALMLACLLRPGKRAKPSFSWPDLFYPAAVAALFGLPFFLGIKLKDFGFTGVAAHDLALIAVVLLFRHRPLRLALGVGAVILATYQSSHTLNTVARERSFFGAMTVEADRTFQYMLFKHGTTLHGAQHTYAPLRRDPLTYFHRDGPYGKLIAALKKQNRMTSVGVVGLGIGTLACYRQPGEAWTFYEIDPAVVALARDQRYFHYLADCAPDAPVILGDGRLSLNKEPDGRFDFLALDAFSSDSVPMHLLTREALALYLKKLSPRGVIAFHVSNRHLNLKPVLARLAADAGLTARVHPRRNRPGLERQWKYSADLVVMVRKPDDLPPALRRPPWKPLVAPPASYFGGRVWTDDFSNILEAIK